MENPKLRKMLISLGLSLILFVLAWGRSNQDTFRKEVFSSKAVDTTPILNTTSLTDEVYREEVSTLLKLEGKAFRKHIIDNREFRQYLPSTYDVKGDLLSVSLVTKKKQGEGVTLRMETPTLFSVITLEGFKNAIATAGVSDADIVLATPAETSGTNALSGVFPHFIRTDADRERMELAQSELEWISYLTKHYFQDISTPKRINQAFASIKYASGTYGNQAIGAMISQSISTHWARNDLPTLRPEDKKGLETLFGAYQKSEATSDKESNKMLRELKEVTRIEDRLTGEGVDYEWSEIAQ